MYMDFQGVFLNYTIQITSTSIDNDASDEIKEIIQRLKISDTKKYIIGEKEFEDAFTNEVLLRVGKRIMKTPKGIAPYIGRSKISNKSEMFARTKTKNSPIDLRRLGAGGKKLTKPIFGQALARVH